MQKSKFKITIQNLKLFKFVRPKAGYKTFAFCLLPFELKKGFTLIETMVAISVLLAALAGPVSLISRGLLVASAGKNKLVALGLAQEGIELVRLVRENNVLCDGLNGATVWNWTEGLSPPNFTRMDPISFINIDCGAVPPESIPTPHTPLDASPPALRLETNAASPNFGLYQYQSGTATNFSRTIEVRSPPTGTPDPDVSPQFQMDVISTVTWTERGSQKSVKLLERFFDWR